VIGDEILSGRTEDKNINFLAKNLTEIGVNLKEVIVVADDQKQIIANLNFLRKKYHYVFTSGGIGPTHDDITSQSVAIAFGEKLIQNQQATEILINYYGAENLNKARLKMAMVPQSAKLLDNSVSSAPGFSIENVFVMAGVPKIFQAMFFAAKKELVGGDIIKSKELKISLAESVVAKDLTDLQNKYPEVSMGSYPAKDSTSLVFRSINYHKLDESFLKMVEIVESLKKGSVIEK
jgi:molybdenum cofactor synthesis domain-containing protein